MVVSREPLRQQMIPITDIEAQKLGHMPGLRYDNDRRQWLAPWNMLPFIDPQRATPSTTGACPENWPDGTVLRPHQVGGAAFIRAHNQVLLGDQLRTGKTGTIVAAHEPATGPLVVIGPLATEPVWLAWFARRWPDQKPLVLRGRTYDRTTIHTADLVFAHYDILKTWADAGASRRLGMLVFDEGHLLTNRNSGRYRAAKFLSAFTSRCVVSTGTPLWNKPAGVWSILDLVQPGQWGNYYAFTERYASGEPGSHGWVVGAPSNTAEFQRRLSTVLLRRTWRELNQTLHPTNRQTIQVPVSPKMAHELDCAFGDHVSAAPKTMAVGVVAAYRQAIGVIKVPTVVDAAQNERRHGPVVVWTWHKRVGQLIHKSLGDNCWFVHGEVAPSKREAILNKWRASEDGVLVMSISIGQAGIDLSHGTCCIFAELDWTPATMSQAEMRTFHLERANRIIYVVVAHKIEQRLVNVMVEKCEHALCMGLPASETPIEIESDEAPASLIDPNTLAARIRAKVLAEGNTYR